MRTPEGAVAKLACAVSVKAHDDLCHQLLVPYAPDCAWAEKLASSGYTLKPDVSCSTSCIATPQQQITAHAWMLSTQDDTGRISDTVDSHTHPDAPHAVSELLVHAENIGLADSLASRRLVQYLVLGAAERVSQPRDILFRHMQSLLYLTEAELLICTTSHHTRGTAKKRQEQMPAKMKQLALLTYTLTMATEGKSMQGR